MRQPGEPSVEEILESIKLVITRDNPAAARPRRDEGAHGDAPLPDALQDEDEDVLDLGASGEVVEAAPGSDPLVRPEARESMRESLAALAALSEPGAPPQIVRSGETSLEGMVRDMLRPALAEWLDRNLPPLVERMVADEIARIMGKRR